MNYGVNSYTIMSYVTINSATVNNHFVWYIYENDRQEKNLSLVT